MYVEPLIFVVVLPPSAVGVYRVAESHLTVAAFTATAAQQTATAIISFFIVVFPLFVSQWRATLCRAPCKFFTERTES